MRYIATGAFLILICFCACRKRDTAIDNSSVDTIVKTKLVDTFYGSIHLRKWIYDNDPKRLILDSMYPSVWVVSYERKDSVFVTDLMDSKFSYRFKKQDENAYQHSDIDTPIWSGKCWISGNKIVDTADHNDFESSILMFHSQRIFSGAKN